MCRLDDPSLLSDVLGGHSRIHPLAPRVSGSPRRAPAHVGSPAGASASGFVFPEFSGAGVGGGRRGDCRGPRSTSFPRDVSGLAQSRSEGPTGHRAGGEVTPGPVSAWGTAALTPEETPKAAEGALGLVSAVSTSGDLRLAALDRSCCSRGRALPGRVPGAPESARPGARPSP